MRFELTDEQQMVQGLAREFAEQEVKPIAAECDRESRFPHATVKRMGELGLLGIMVPERLGGGGAGTLRGGRHIAYTNQPSMANLLVALMDKMGVPVERIGGSTGKLPLEAVTI